MAIRNGLEFGFRISIHKFSRLGAFMMFMIHDSFIHDVLKGSSLLSFQNLCVHMHVHEDRTKFGRNCSLE